MQKLSNNSNHTKTLGKLGTKALQTVAEYPLNQVFSIKGQDKKYKFSAWVKSNVGQKAHLVLATCGNPAAGSPVFPNPNTAPSYVEVAFSNTQGKWKLVEVEIDLQAIRQAANLSANQQLYIHAYVWNPNLKNIELDGVRFHPSDAFVQTFDYDKNSRQLLTTENENRLHSSYEYDDFQRLKLVRDFEGNILATNEYYYKGTSTTNNHIKTQLVRKQGKQSLADLVGLPVDDLAETYQYLDGLGRPLQIVARQQSPKKYDVVSTPFYDKYGRQPRSYLPFVSSQQDGNFNASGIPLTHAYYIGLNEEMKTYYPYAATVFEASPLNRVKEKSSLGDGWQLGAGHTSTVNYLLNNDQEVLNLQRPASGAYYYDKNTLYKQVHVNPQGQQSISYSDLMGRTILTKQQINGSWASTYTVYDAFGNVKAIIPPLAVEKMQTSGNYNTTAYTELIYTYKHDDRQRLIEKKIPNKGRIDYVYDPLDRLVAVQDAKQRPQQEWMIYKYDKYGREIITAFLSLNASRASYQSAVNASPPFYEEKSSLNYNNNQGYTNITTLINGNNILTVNYYDDYDFDRDGVQDADNTYLQQTNYPSSYFNRINGLPTGQKVRLLDGSNTFLKTISFYDDRGRNIQTQSENHVGGKDILYHNSTFAL